MPSSLSAIKRVRVSKAARLYNRATRSKISTSRRAMLTDAGGSDKDKALQTFKRYCSTLDKAAKKGVIKKNTAIRRKRRAAAKLAAMEPTR